MGSSNNQECECANKTKLILACSGASDVGELTDKAARTLTQRKIGKMNCLAKVGAQDEGVLAEIRSAEKVLVIDGCKIDCGRRTLLLAGITDFDHLCLADLGYLKGNSPLSSERIDDVVQESKQILCH